MKKILFCLLLPLASLGQGLSGGGGSSVASTTGPTGLTIVNDSGGSGQLTTDGTYPLWGGTALVLGLNTPFGPAAQASLVLTDSTNSLTITGDGTGAAQLFLSGTSISGANLTGVPWVSLTGVPDLFSSTATGPVTYASGVSAIANNALTLVMLPQIAALRILANSSTISTANVNTINPAALTVMTKSLPSPHSASYMISVGGLVDSLGRPLYTQILTGTAVGQVATLLAVTNTGYQLFFKNQSTQPWNVVASNTTAILYTSSTVSAITLAPNDGVFVVSDGTYWDVFTQYSNALQVSGSGSANINPNGLLLGQMSETSIATPGVTVGDIVTIGPPAAPPSFISWAGYVSASGTTVIRLSAIATVTGTTQSWNVLVAKHP